MKLEILYCTKCKNYTIEKICLNCKKPCITPKPPRYSQEDKQAAPRLKYKKRYIYK